MFIYDVGAEKVCIIENEDTRDTFMHFPFPVDVLICSKESWVGKRKAALLPVIKEDGQLILV